MVRRLGRRLFCAQEGRVTPGGPRVRRTVGPNQTETPNPEDSERRDEGGVGGEVGVSYKGVWYFLERTRQSERTHFFFPGRSVASDNTLSFLGCTLSDRTRTCALANNLYMNVLKLTGSRLTASCMQRIRYHRYQIEQIPQYSNPHDGHDNAGSP